MGSPSQFPSGSIAPPPLHWVKPPQQARSQKTLERVLDAAEVIIAERGAAALTVSEVVRRAGSSVGAFYARFPDKDALLSMLHERSCVEALATAELALDPARWRSTSIERVVAEVVQFTAAQCRERRGLVLAFISIAANDPKFAARRADLEAGIANLLSVFLSARETELSHPDLRIAASVSIRIILGALEYGQLVQRALPEDPQRDARLTAELSGAVVSYLGVRGR